MRWSTTAAHQAALVGHRSRQWAAPWLGLALLCVHCAPSLQSAPQTGAPAPRRAPGVPVLELATLPNAVADGDAAENVLVLRAPAPARSVEPTLLAFFSALQNESPVELAQVLDGSAVANFGGGGTGTSALGTWVRRFARADYHGLSPQALVGPTQLEVLTSHDVARLREVRSFGLSPGGSEVLAVLSIDAPDSALLGKSMEFLLRRSDDGYRIGATFETLGP